LERLTSIRAEYRLLLQVYTPEHPPAQELAERIRRLEEEEIPELFSQLVNQLREEERQLASRIEASGTEIAQIPPRAIEEARLRRGVDIAEALYTELRGRYEEASLARASSIPDVRILDRAVIPDGPANDQRARLAGMLFLGFLGAGLAGAVLLDRVDSRLRTPDQISRAFGLTVLGTVPRIEPSRNKKVKTAANASEVTEAFRGLRTNLLYAYGSAGPMVITVSSSGPEEGKTTVTSNLARSFAELGRRVVIVDADTRRGDLHRVFSGLRKPGLTDLLRATASGEEVLQHGDQPKLDFIGSGTQVASSPELLSSRRMGWLLTALKKRYDVILVDSPPLGAGADALVLSSLTSHLVLVVRSGETDREFTKAQIEPLSRLPVRILGVVLNDFAPDRLSGYRYYSSYLPGYEAGAEQAEEDRRLAAVRGKDAAAGENRAGGFAEPHDDDGTDSEADEAGREGAGAV
jgi:capsular exopolysaccharide synthesis family protein